MNKKKGMSQILTIIIAASVLMMTALTLVFMVQGGLSDLFGGSNKQACANTIKSKCAATTGTVAIPTPCNRVEGNITFVNNIHDSAEGGELVSGNNRYQCPE